MSEMALSNNEGFRCPKPALILSLLFGLALVSCTDDPVESQLKDAGGAEDDPAQSHGGACNPFVKDDIPIVLEEIIAVGEDAEGVLYVVEESEAVPETRAFISEGETLYRQEVLGGSSGHGPEGESYGLTLRTADGGEITLLVEIDAAGDVKMAIVRDEEYEGRISEIGENGELLQVLDESAVSSMAVKNLENIVFLEYFAVVENGDTIVVTRPENDWSYEDFELFYGKAEQMIERPVSDVLRASDGGSTRISFSLDGKEAEVFFPIHLTEEDAEWGEATLTVGNDTLAVTRKESDDFIAEDYTFTCLDE